MNEKYEVITISIAAEKCGVHTSTVRRYVRRELVEEPLTEIDLVTLRRVRRLRDDLGVNLAGVEVILHMRRQIEDLQAEVDRLRKMMS